MDNYFIQSQSRESDPIDFYSSAVQESAGVLIQNQFPNSAVKK